MAVYNEILVGRFNRGIQKLFGIKGGPPARQLSSEIAVNHQLQSGVENRYLEGWNIVAASYQAAASGAGQSSGIRVRNPKASNAVIVVFALTYVDLTTNTANNYGSLTQGSTILDLTTGATAPPTLDSRFAMSSVAIVSTQINPPGVLNVVRFFPHTLNVQVDLIQPQVEIPLLPGQALQVTSAPVTGSSPLINIMWRERFLEDSERF